MRMLNLPIYPRHYEKMIMAESFSIESTVRGHHVYKESWSSSIGEELSAQPESDNVFDKFAVADTHGAHTKGDLKDLLVFPSEETKQYHL